ncbi:MAG TPA: carboxypeptidase regulatory-like domain-containing protein, partial [Pyrinomonadaceae bacterium]|nr:carboxypeptidase regulatory-like domain-containing protein [Pyrinomonadaceae bacterium]
MTLIFVTIGFAQDLDNVTITGKITDSNNAPIVGANITATLTQTGKERSVVTDDEGRFTIVKLEPGTYSVKFSANGFGAKEQKDLVTVAGQNVQLTISLSPAGVTAEQIITIDGDDAPPVDTTRTVVGGTIEQREIEELPNNSRSPLDLVLTLGGTSEEALSTKDLAEDRNQNSPTAPAEQGNFSLSGGTSYSNNITIDGLDNNDDRSANARFQPSLESIAEVQVISNQFSAEYGRASGGRVNIRTRAGGNKFRGRAFMFFRDDNLNANSWYNNSRGFSRLPMTEYNPGFTFSGPIFKNKTFFSVAYEYTNLKDTTLIDTWVPVTANSRFTLPTSNAPCPSGVTCTDTNSATPTP